MRVTVKSQGDLLSLFSRDGYNECSNGNWRKGGYPTFWFWMFQDCCGLSFEVVEVRQDRLELSDGNVVHRDWVDF